MVPDSFFTKNCSISESEASYRPEVNGECEEEGASSISIKSGKNISEKSSNPVTFLDVSTFS